MPEVVHMVCRHGDLTPRMIVCRAGGIDDDDCEGSVTSPNSNAELPTLQINHPPDEVRARLTKLSKRGKLPGYESNEPGAVCSVAAHGTPFDSKLLVHLESNSLSFSCVLLPLMPRVFALILVVAVWPGLPLTDSFLSSFDWYNNLMGSIGIKTWHWYLPLTILPAPFAFRGAIMKSRISAHQSALEAIEKIKAAL
jgi:hypothetical protein